MSKASRQSNIELLRIVSMLLIVVYHIFVYVLNDYASEYPIITPLSTISHIGVIVFVLISGYFGIKPSIRGFLSLYITMVFYNILLSVGWVYVGDNSLGISELVKISMPFSHSAPWLWFMKIYIYLYLLSPLLNKVRDFSVPQANSKSRIKVIGGVIC